MGPAPAGGGRLSHVKYATRVERFRAGDYPPVCVRSGRPADKFVPVEAARRAAWPWFLFPISIVGWLLSWKTVDRDRLWGHLPFTTGEVGAIEATWDKREQVVVLSGVHPAFVGACKRQQGTS